MAELRHVATPPVRSLAVHAFVAALLLYVATSGGSLGSSDAVVTFEVTRSLVERTSVALPENLLGHEANRGVDGRYYSQFGIGQSIYNVPFYLAGRAMQDLSGMQMGKPDSLTKAAVALGSTVAAAGTVATVFLLAWLITGRARPSLVAAFACGAASLLWPYARLGFNAPLTAWILTAAGACLYAGIERDRPHLLAIAGGLVGAGCLTRHEFVLVAIPFVVWMVLARRETRVEQRRLVARRLLVFLPGVSVGLALWMTYNMARFGDAWIVGYAPRYGLGGHYGLLLSPAESVFLYSPTIILGVIGVMALARRDVRTAWLLAAPAIVLFLFYGTLTDWAGGRSYGPRYLVPVLPLLMVPIAPLFADASRRGRRAMVGVIVLSAIVQLPGVLVDYGRVSQSWAQTASPHDLENRRYRWAASPLVLDTNAAIGALRQTVAHQSGRQVPPELELVAAADRRDFSQQFAFSVDFWWLHLFYFGVVPPVVAWGTGLILVTASIIVAGRAWTLACRMRSLVHRR